eukprot:CAMPEP_0182526576 /NCGR_PEP_ID=MMETSP1323-20130603/3288_1 /TAXON_ID=236787 /ORGANISM="Florenciella parvula, Strain RCC1693" /LENGTH=152 /DNA_ID=CAMNT_0024735457 /DNA_START=14 /DNA_END=472 /DNA_ORIENTATION=-
MVHRAIFGSIERFFGILVESTAGDMPLWLAPVQLRLLPVTDQAQEWCRDLAKRARKMGLRVEVDRGSERLAKQIRNAEQARIPIMAVVGEAEMGSDTLAVRSRKAGDLGSLPVDNVLTLLQAASEQAIEMQEVDGFEMPPPKVVEAAVEQEE